MWQRIILLAVTLIVAAGHFASAGDTPWVITAKDTHNYTPAALGNGHLGLVTDSTGMRPRELYTATFHSRGVPGDVSRIRSAIVPINLYVGNDTTGSATEFLSQSLDMRCARLTTTVRTQGMQITTTLRVLRQLPNALMADVEVKALRDIDAVITNRMRVPSSVADVTIRNRTVWCEDGGKRIMQAYGTDVTGNTRIAATAIMEPVSGCSLLGADSILIRLRRDEKADFHVIATVCTDGDFADPVNESERMAIYASRVKPSTLIAGHNDAWERIWQGDIRIQGNDELQLQVRSALYNLYSSLREGSRHSIAPMGLTSEFYGGHIFWDADTWILPVMAVLQPDMARSMLNFRYDGLPAARRRALAYGYRGAMFPWEADYRGEEATPTHALTGPLEHHITADVANAAWQYFCATSDTTWLAREGHELITAAADFIVSRATPNADGTYSINNVVGADEYAIGVDDNAFTNASAQTALRNAVKSAAILGLRTDPAYTAVADGIKLHRLPSGIVREHRTYDGELIKQADAILLAYPLNQITDPGEMRRTMDYYAVRTDSINGPAMTHSIMAVQYARMSDVEQAAKAFRRAYEPYMRAPFYSFAETPSNNHTYFMTGAGGLLQAILFGYYGLHITDGGIVKGATILPPDVKSISISVPESR